MIITEIVEVPGKCYHNTSIMGGGEGDSRLHPTLLTEWLETHGKRNWRLVQIIEGKAIFQKEATF